MGKDVKIILGVIVATVVIIFAGVFLSNKTQNKATPTANPSLLIRENSIKSLAPNERAVLVEFGDLQCPACGAYHPLVKQAREEFKDNLTYVFRHFPLPQHKNAMKAALALEAAGRQAKYWEMQDKLYDTQDEWSNLEDPTGKFLTYAASFKLNEAKFVADMNDPVLKKKIEDDTSDGNLLKVNSTPTFYLNGVKLDLFQNYDELKKVINEAMSSSQITQSGEEGAYHTHFDVKIFVDGVSLDLSQDKYQSKEGAELNPDIHLHSKNGKIVHIHKKGATLGELLASLKLGSTGKLYVNGSLKGDLVGYEPQDLDHIVIVLGKATDAQIKTMLASVSNDACIYSEKCPERGTPPPEECVGGLGTGCE